MNKQQFYAEIEGVLDLDSKTIRGDERLNDLPGWDSMAMLSFIAMVDSSLGIIVSASSLSTSKTVADLVALCGDKITA